MFDLFPRRTNLKDLLSALPEPPMYTSYPVLKETCSCGASSEIVAYDKDQTETHFVRWRRDHKCKTAAKPQSPAEDAAPAQN